MKSTFTKSVLIMIAVVMAVMSFAVTASAKISQPLPYDDNSIVDSPANPKFPTDQKMENDTPPITVNPPTTTGQVLGVTDTTDNTSTTFNRVIGVVIALLVSAAIITLIVAAIWSSDKRKHSNYAHEGVENSVSTSNYDNPRGTTRK